MERSGEYSHLDSVMQSLHGLRALELTMLATHRLVLENDAEICFRRCIELFHRSRASCVQKVKTGVKRSCHIVFSTQLAYIIGIHHITTILVLL